LAASNSKQQTKNLKGGSSNKLTISEPLVVPKQLTLEQIMKKLNVKFVPRTGIDQPFMIQAPKFIETTKEFERNANVNVS